MHKNCSRRHWLLRTAAAVPGAWLAGSPLSRAADGPALPVAVAKCKTYDAAELSAHAVQRCSTSWAAWVAWSRARPSAIKINLTGAPTYRLG